MIGYFFNPIITIINYLNIRQIIISLQVAPVKPLYHRLNAPEFARRCPGLSPVFAWQIRDIYTSVSGGSINWRIP